MCWLFFCQLCVFCGFLFGAKVGKIMDRRQKKVQFLCFFGRFIVFLQHKTNIMTDLNYICFKREGIEISVSLFVFKEGDTYIAYCPSLDLSGYDLTEESARSDFDYMLADYLNEQLRNGTLRNDLALHGWKLGKMKGNEPELSDMLGMNEQLRKLVMKSYKKTNVNKTCAMPS